MVDVQQTVPATLNYAPPGHSPYPASLCTSVNHVVCHGIPGEKKLKDGDIINIDVTVIKDGYHGDTSRMFFIGKPSIQARRLVEVTYEAMWRGIRAVRPGAHLGDIGATIQKHAEGHGFSVVREFCGHGIGKQFHEEPQVLHYGRAGTGLKLQPGMVFTIEPMINAGRPGIRCLADGWTIVTADHSLSAQWEHTVLVTPDGYEIMSELAILDYELAASVVAGEHAIFVVDEAAAAQRQPPALETNARAVEIRHAGAFERDVLDVEGPVA